MAKNYSLQFGSGSATLTSGLSPTFTYFVRLDTGATTAPPGITQIISTAGIYKFSYTPSFPIAFQVDGATSGLGTFRYINGQLDNIDQIDDLLLATGGTLQAIGSTLNGIGTTNIALGTTNVALGTTAVFLAGSSGSAVGIGNTLTAIVGNSASSFGSNVVDPSTLYGYLKRMQEVLEGDANYTKSTGIWTMLDRTGGTTLINKTMSSSSTVVTKT